MTSMDAIARARQGSRRGGRWFGTAALIALGAACSSSSNNATDAGNSSATDAGPGGLTCQYTVMPQTAPMASCGSPGGPAPGGMPDSHCGSGATAMATVTGMCVGVPDAAAPSAGDDGGNSAAGDDAGMGGDAGNDGTCGESGYGPTNYGMTAGDDDCKYNVSWTSTPVCENGNVYFTVTVTKRAGADGKLAATPAPLTGASVTAEVYYNDCATIAPNSGQTTSEQGNGMYKVGPIQFSKAGNWVVRFHFNECCSDIPQDSPHGHAAFWVAVP